MKDAGCCELTMARERPGALWHIFDPHDVDKIRDLLNKVSHIFYLFERFDSVIYRNWWFFFNDRFFAGNLIDRHRRHRTGRNLCYI